MNQVDWSCIFGWAFLTVGIVGIVYAPFMKNTTNAIVTSLTSLVFVAIGFCMIG